MRISRILIAQLIVTNICLAAYSAGWLWSYRVELCDLGNEITALCLRSF